MPSRWRPRKRLGQNFLVDRAIAERIVEFAGVRPEETVLEIGPGRGALTGLLCQRAAGVVAVEIDAEMARAVAEKVPSDKLTVVEQDILSADLSELAAEHGVERWPVVANLPYVISSRMIMRLVEQVHAVERATVMVQREVGERFLAGPGSRTYGLLSVLLQATGTLKKGFRVPAGAFRPRPKVQSLVLTWQASPPEGLDLCSLIQTAKAAFNQRRKRLDNALGRLPGFTDGELHIACLDARIDPGARAEHLSAEEFIRLSAALALVKAAKQ